MFKHVTVTILLALMGLTFLQAQPSHGNFRQGPPNDFRFQNREKESMPEGLMRFRGILIDCEWAATGKTDKGKDCLKKPRLITKKRLLSEPAIQAGYGILAMTPDSPQHFFKFDDAGNLKVLGFLKDDCKASRKIKVEATGVLNEQGTICLLSIREDRQTEHRFEHSNRPPMGPGHGGGGMPNPSGME